MTTTLNKPTPPIYAMIYGSDYAQSNSFFTIDTNDVSGYISLPVNR